MTLIICTELEAQVASLTRELATMTAMWTGLRDTAFERNAKVAATRADNERLQGALEAARIIAESARGHADQLRAGHRVLREALEAVKIEPGISSTAWFIVDEALAAVSPVEPSRPKESVMWAPQGGGARDHVLEEAAREASATACSPPCEHKMCYGARAASARIRGMKSRPKESPGAPIGEARPTCASWCGKRHDTHEHDYGQVFQDMPERVQMTRCFCTEACRDAGKPMRPSQPDLAGRSGGLSSGPLSVACSLHGAGVGTPCLENYEGGESSDVDWVCIARAMRASNPPDSDRLRPKESREPGRDQTLEEAAVAIHSLPVVGIAVVPYLRALKAAADAVRALKSRPQESPSAPREPGKCETCGGTRQAEWPIGGGNYICKPCPVCRPSNPGDSEKERP